MRLLVHALYLFAVVGTTADAAAQQQEPNLEPAPPPRDNRHHKNMNPGVYTVANSQRHVTNYHRDEYFEVYSPVISTKYSQVYWHMQEAVPLPADIVERFAGGGIMAVTGYEVDQVRVNRYGKEVSVPITWAYNHHYGAGLQNTKQTRLEKRSPLTQFKPHGAEYYWAAVETNQIIKSTDDETLHTTTTTTTTTLEIPLAQFFSEANGGEFRQSYHGYPSGYAQLIESPDTFWSFPMQIDTWNRQWQTNATYTPGGPLPRNSRIPPTAGYSGLIECPCSDRLRREWHMTYALVQDNNSNNSDNDNHKCTGAVQNDTECWQAAATVIPALKMTTRYMNDETQPTGCSVVQDLDGSIQALWNHHDKKVQHDQALRSEQVPYIKQPQQQQQQQEWVAFTSIPDAAVNMTVGLDATQAKITLTGPADKWFGVAWGSDSMCIHMQADECPTGGPYAVVVDKEDGIHERKLDFHGSGRVLKPSLTVLSDTTSPQGERTIVVTRPLQGLTKQHYTFDTRQQSLPIIAARGCSVTFAKHCGHASTQLNFLTAHQVTPICQAGIVGSIDGGRPFAQHRCAAAPYSDLITQNNPTCQVQTYRGGLHCCRDGRFLLDTDQEIPWADQLLEYRLKFRFYFQEYTAATAEQPASHQSLVRLYWQTEAHAGEYDITQCPPGTPPDHCVQMITSRFKVSDMMVDCSTRPDASWCTGKGSKQANETLGIELIYAAPHCHAPTCLTMELYNADTGQLLCHVEPQVGKGNLEQLYDEKGFLAIPPCLWGDASEGLPSPQLLSLDTTLLSIKRNNNTLGHTGEMASWQMRGIVVPTTEAQKKQMKNLDTLGQGMVDTDEDRRGQLRRKGN